MSILLLLALALLWVGSQPSRAPRLLGSMAGNQPLEVRLTSSVGGVGRFARPRFGRPGRL